MRDVTFVVMEMSENVGSVTGDYEFEDEDEDGEEGVIDLDFGESGYLCFQIYLKDYYC